MGRRYLLLLLTVIPTIILSNVYATERATPRIKAHTVNIKDRRHHYPLRRKDKPFTVTWPSELQLQSGQQIYLTRPIINLTRIPVQQYNLPSPPETASVSSQGIKTTCIDPDPYLASVNIAVQNYHHQLKQKKLMSELKMVFGRHNKRWYDQLLNTLFPGFYKHWLEGRAKIEEPTYQEKLPPSPPEPSANHRTLVRERLLLFYRSIETAPAWLEPFQSWFDNCTLLWQVIGSEAPHLHMLLPYRAFLLKPEDIQISEQDTEEVTEDNILELHQWIDQQPAILEAMGKVLAPELIDVLKSWLRDIADQFEFSEDWRETLLNEEQREDLEYVPDDQGAADSEEAYELEIPDTTTSDLEFFSDPAPETEIEAAANNYYQLISTGETGPVYNKRITNLPEGSPIPSLPEDVTKRLANEWELLFDYNKGMHYYTKTGAAKDEKNKVGCGYCALNKDRKTHITSHIARLHFKERLYTCSHKGCMNPKTGAPWSFSRSDELKRHTQTHSPESKNLSCQICGKKFNRTDHLTKHVARHSNPKNTLSRKYTSTSQPVTGLITTAVSKTSRLPLLHSAAKPTRRLNNLPPLQPARPPVVVVPIQPALNSINSQLITQLVQAVIQLRTPKAK